METTMADPTNAIGWFEIGTDRPEEAQQFYGSLFGWTFAPDDTADMDYRIVTTGDDHPVRGGIFGTGGAAPNYAVFCVVVDDVRATAARAEELGGKVLVAPVDTPNGLAFAHLLDQSGNHFSIYSPPAGETS
jgi:uncharacterized protein